MFLNSLKQSQTISKQKTKKYNHVSFNDLPLFGLSSKAAPKDSNVEMEVIRAPVENPIEGGGNLRPVTVGASTPLLLGSGEHLAT